MKCCGFWRFYCFPSSGAASFLILGKRQSLLFLTKVYIRRSLLFLMGIWYIIMVFLPILSERCFFHPFPFFVLQREPNIDLNAKRSILQYILYFRRRTTHPVSVLSCEYWVFTVLHTSICSLPTKLKYPQYRKNLKILRVTRIPKRARTSTQRLGTKQSKRGSMD